MVEHTYTLEVTVEEDSPDYELVSRNELDAIVRVFVTDALEVSGTFDITDVEIVNYEA